MIYYDTSIYNGMLEYVCVQHYVASIHEMGLFIRQNFLLWATHSFVINR